ncbi:MAG TPA: alpha-amylase family glycosyl hydrolase [Chthoniobacterales bacterium]
MKFARRFALLCAASFALASPVSAADDSPAERIRIYQLFVRLFGNTNETRKQNGTVAENGVGKFNDINDAALASLREMGFTHVWLTGVLQQATGTDYSTVGQPADDPALLKGVAGSPYAIKDYYDVCPDYAEQPEKRLDEFNALLARMHEHQLRALVDIVPNHVARSYASDVKPELDFGKSDEKSKFFDPQNNFFYLKAGNGGPPLRLPRKDRSTAIYPPEKEHGRVSGNNVVSWAPSIDDWYETVKLNYGFDFTAASKNVREYPNASAPNKPLPDTWKKMDQVLAYWQSLGVDGFRCDMAHMEPPEFWAWAIPRARERNPQVVFIAEAYDNDPAKVPATNSNESNCMFHLLKAGFTAIYDDPTYKALKKIYDGPGWANDIDDARPNEFIFDRSLRYAENHDEVRLAAAKQWGNVGMKAGPAICAILYGLSRGPVMLYNGQEVGEPAAGIEGFGSDDSRTSIFDYWSMPEVVKWVNDHNYDGARLSAEQKELRDRYARLLHLMNEPAFRDGKFLPLNHGNKNNPRYGRISGETVSGHWLYSFMRIDPASGQTFLVAVNLHPRETMKDVRITIPREHAGSMWRDRFAGSLSAAMSDQEVTIADIPPLTPLLLEATKTQ